jgi:hypothetical protein
MKVKDEVGSTQLSNTDLARVLSPLLLFLAHCAYLILWSQESFFNKWIDGSFSFFVSLVLCNIIRARAVAATTPAGEDSADDGDRPATNVANDKGAGENRDAQAGSEHLPG